MAFLLHLKNVVFGRHYSDKKSKVIEIQKGIIVIRYILIGLCFSFFGCIRSEPSNAEIAQGMKTRFLCRTGAYSANIDAKAKKIGKGRWAVLLTAERNGEWRSINATAVMDKNGNIHYYTE